MSSQSGSGTAEEVTALEPKVEVAIPTVTPIPIAADPISAAETAVVDEKKVVEKDTRGEIHKLLDDALADVEKGLDWFKAEIAKL